MICSICNSILGSIIGGVASLAGSALGLKSNSDTNKANLKAVQATNASNERIASENRDFQLQMWNAQNAYNDPSAQAQRMLAAGINPYMSSEISSGVSTSTPQGSVAQMQAPQFNSAADIYQNAGNSLANIAFQAELQDANAKKVNSEASYTQMRTTMEQAKISAEIVKLRQEAKTEEQRSFVAELEKKFLNDTFNDRVASVANTNDFMRAQIINQQAQTNLTNIEAEISNIRGLFLPQQLSQELALTSAQIMSSQASAKASLASARMSVQSALTEKVRRAGLRISNEQARKLVKSVVKEAEYNSMLRQQQAINYRDYGTLDIGESYDISGKVGAKAGTPFAGVSGEVSGSYRGKKKLIK